MLPKTFCALPFYQLTIAPDGKAKLCDHNVSSTFNMMSEEDCLSFHWTTLDKIWNSEHFRSVRYHMIEGTEIKECRRCYEREAEGGTSLRQIMNSLVRDAVLEVPGDKQIFERAEAVVCSYGGKALPPAALHLWLGNRCNLKCRTCHPMFSSQIASDFVHSKWREDAQTQSERLLQLDWTKDEKAVFEKIFKHPEYLRHIWFSGGEPMINPVFPAILKRLVETGHAAHIRLYINSNGTQHSATLSALLKEFQSVELGISVDGFGPLQEYIRSPSQWDTIVRNIFAFRAERVPLSIRPTVQAYNIFGLLELVRWCEVHQLRIVLDNILYAPSALSVDMLPQAVIDEALQEWVKYWETECTEENRWHVETVIAALRRPRPDSTDLERLQDEFIRFTNDLDHSRGQSFAAACPRLYDRLLKAGFDFHLKYRFCSSWLQLETTTRKLQEENSGLKHQLIQTQAELSQARAEIEEMRSSKFWKLRTFWFSIKRRLSFLIT